MSRPIRIAEDDLLAAARAVFTERGVRATTAEVAARAGVSEGILFKRYGSKAALFRCAMNTGAEVSTILDELLALGPLRSEKDFVRLAALLLEKLRSIIPFVLMSWQNRSEIPFDPKGTTPPPMRAVMAISKYFETQMKAGVLVARNPEVTARILIGSVWHFAFLEVALEAHNTDLPAETFTKELGRMLFADLGRPSATRAGGAKRKKKVP